MTLFVGKFERNGDLVLAEVFSFAAQKHMVSKEKSCTVSTSAGDIEVEATFEELCDFAKKYENQRRLFYGGFTTHARDPEYPDLSEEGLKEYREAKPKKDSPGVGPR